MYNLLRLESLCSPAGRRCSLSKPQNRILSREVRSWRASSCSFVKRSTSLSSQKVQFGERGREQGPDGRSKETCDVIRLKLLQFGGRGWERLFIRRQGLGTSKEIGVSWTVKLVRRPWARRGRSPSALKSPHPSIDICVREVRFERGSSVAVPTEPTLVWKWKLEEH